MTELVEKLYNTGELSDSELKALIETDDSETAELLSRSPAIAGMTAFTAVSAAATKRLTATASPARR